MIKPLEIAHQLLEEVISSEDVVVDATMGNGYDTVFLAGLSDHVFAFDVQEEAIAATKKRLVATDKKAELILDGHENLASYIQQQIKAAIFNLGYLPNTDKTVITRSETTIKALSVLTEKLVVGGRIAIMIYYGHEGGLQEKNAVFEWASALPQKEWHVFSYAPLNQIHTPPMLIILEKR